MGASVDTPVPAQMRPTWETDPLHLVPPAVLWKASQTPVAFPNSHRSIPLVEALQKRFAVAAQVGNLSPSRKEVFALLSSF